MATYISCLSELSLVIRSLVVCSLLLPFDLLPPYSLKILNTLSWLSLEQWNNKNCSSALSSFIFLLYCSIIVLLDCDDFETCSDRVSRRASCLSSLRRSSTWTYSVTDSGFSPDYSTDWSKSCVQRDYTLHFPLAEKVRKCVSFLQNHFEGCEAEIKMHEAQMDTRNCACNALVVLLWGKSPQPSQPLDL